MAGCRDWDRLRLLLPFPCAAACFSAAADGHILAFDVRGSHAAADDDDEAAAFGAGANAHEPSRAWGLGAAGSGTLGRSYGVNTLTLTARPTSLVSGGADGKVKLWSLAGAG